MPTAKENRSLVIEGDLLRVQRTVIEREVKTSEFINEIARLQPLDTGPLPQGCVWYARRENDSHRTVSVYGIERPAGMQNIRFKAGGSGEHQEEIKDLALSWPITLWFVRCIGDAVQDVHLACTRTPIAEQGRDTRLLQLLVPNQYDLGNGAICMGNLVLKEGLPLTRRVEEIVSQTLASLWNMDLIPAFENTGIASLEDWAAKSAANADFHKQVRFPDHQRQTVDGMLTHLLESAEE